VVRSDAALRIATHARADNYDLAGVQQAQMGTHGMKRHIACSDHSLGLNCPIGVKIKANP